MKLVRVFGCDLFILNQPEGSKFAPKASVVIFIDVLEQGVYKVLVRDHFGKYSITESRHVTLYESKFPGTPGLE